MNFAKNILGKYGWKEGDGLGRNSDGITKPLKANYKFNNSGLGHNKADEMNNHWWEHAYNKASANISISNSSEKSVQITTKNCSSNTMKKEKNIEKNSNYGGSFLKSATLTNEGREVEDPNKQVISPLMLKIVSDDELFKACGGRTTHKGARHGLKLSGKLNRIEEQEKELIQKMKSTADSSKVFKDYVDCKSRLNARKLKRLKSRKNKKSRRATSSLESTRINGDEHEQETKVKEEIVQKEKHPKVKLHKLHKLANGKVEKKRKEKKLKKVTKKVHVSESKEHFLKKMAIEEVAISFEFKKKRHSIDQDDNISVHSYRDSHSLPNELSQSDNDDNEAHQNVVSQLSEKLSKVKKRKQKIIVENLTEFQMEHLRNAHVPFVEVKQSSRKKNKKDAAKMNSLANNLVNQMCIS